MKSNEVIEYLLKELISKLVLCSSVYQIRLFGSQVLRYSVESDVDIAIFCNSKNDYDKILEIVALTSEKFEVLVHPVIYFDDIEKLKQNSFFLENIIEKSIVLY